MGCNILLEDGSRLLLEDGSSALLLDGCTPVSSGPGCNILLDENTGKVLADDGVSAILQDGCTVTPTVETPTGGFVVSVQRRRRVYGLRIPLDDDEAAALAVLQAIRKRRRLDG